MQINLSDEQVEFFPNTADKLDETIRITVPDDLRYRVQNGALLVMNLKDSSGDKIPASSKIVVGAKPPISDFPTGVDKKSYRVYNQLSTAEQYDNEKNIQCKLRTGGEGVSLNEGNELSIWVKSSVVVDKDNSVFELNDVIEESL